MRLLLDAVALRRKPSRPRCIASLQEKPRRCSLATESDVFSEEVRQLLYTVFSQNVLIQILYSCSFRSGTIKSTTHRLNHGYF